MPERRHMARLEPLPSSELFDSYEQYTKHWQLEYAADPDAYEERLRQELADEQFAIIAARDDGLVIPGLEIVEPLAPEIEWHFLWAEWPANLAA
jgi:hypothetical protein